MAYCHHAITRAFGSAKITQRQPNAFTHLTQLAKCPTPPPISPLGKRTLRAVCLHACWALVLACYPSVYAENPAVLANQDTDWGAVFEQTSFSAEPFQDFAQALVNIRTHYVHDVSDNQLFENAIKGMLEHLDPHSSFLDSQAFAQLKMQTAGNFTGIGIEVRQVAATELEIVRALPKSPADRAGIRPGDRVTHIDKKPVHHLGFSQAVASMRGTSGTPVLLTVVSPHTNRARTVRLKREAILVHSVESKALAPHYGYVKISHFQENTAASLAQAVQRLRHEIKPFKGLIVDLRNNPGGILDAAVAVSDLFLDANRIGHQQLIVSTKGRRLETQMQMRASGEDALAGAPLVVLINGHSASASEIVAGALQDHGRAVILGEKSFGKGSIQTVLPLGDQQAIKLTTAWYYTPSGRSIQSQGIVPDIEIPDKPLSSEPTTVRSVQPLAPLAGNTHTVPSTPSDPLLQHALHAIKALQVASWQGKSHGT